MTRCKYTSCCGKISKYKCPHYLSPHYTNSKLFNIAKESNKKSWCKLHDEPLSYASSRYCGMFKKYKISIKIDATAKLLDGVDSPYQLKTKLRAYLIKLLDIYGESPEIDIVFDKVKEDD